MAKTRQKKIAAKKTETHKKARRYADATAVGAAVAAPEVETPAPASELETVAPLEAPAPSPPTRLAAEASVRDENNSPAAAPPAKKRRTTTSRRPFACPIDGCEKTYTRNMTLLIHLAKIHPEHIRPNAFADAFPNYDLQAHASSSPPSRSVAEVAAEVEEQGEVEGEVMEEEATWVCDACLGKTTFNTREELKAHLWDTHRYGGTVIRRATRITQPLFGRGAFV